MGGLDYTKYDGLYNPLNDPDATIRLPRETFLSILSVDQLRKVIADERRESGSSIGDLARESMVPVDAVRMLEESGMGSAHDAVAVLAALHVRPMALPAQLVEAEMDNSRR